MDFDLIWSKYEKELTFFVSARIFDKDSVADIMQEVAIKIYKNKNQLKDIENIRAWLYRVSRNTLIDFYKKNDKKIPEELIIEEEIVEVSSENKVLVCLENISNALKKSDMEILNLSIYEEYTIGEIAKKLNLSVDGAKSRLKRAKKKIAGNFFSCCSLEKDKIGHIMDFKVLKESDCHC